MNIVFSFLKSIGNFPIFIKEIKPNQTGFAKLHANGTLELILIIDDQKGCSMMTYGIDNTSDESNINTFLSNCVQSDAEQWNNALNLIKSFLPND
jgi:hypothetical protein